MLARVVAVLQSGALYRNIRHISGENIDGAKVSVGSYNRAGSLGVFLDLTGRG